MTPQHLVARVVWDSQFDAPEAVRDEQDWLSAFSHTALPGLLQAVFDRCCPSDETWRCECLQLDLGVITLSAAKEDLPRRLQRALEEGLWRQFGHPEPDHAPDTPQARDKLTDALSLLEHLLCHGSLPWWETRQASLPDLWRTLCQQQPAALGALLQRIGPLATVRERLVWQLGPRQMPALLQLIQSGHASALVEWVQTLVRQHVAALRVQDRNAAFESEAWLALLTCLLAERGSLFNLTEFASDHLQRLARRYGLAYVELLRRLYQTSERQALLLPIRFLSLLRAVVARDLPPPATPKPPTDGWQQLARLLARGEPRLSTFEGGQTLSDLLLTMAERDETRTRRLLLTAGRLASELLARHTTLPARNRLVMLLQPAQASLIGTYLLHGQALAHLAHRSDKLVWQSALACLLDPPRAGLSLARLISDTLLLWQPHYGHQAGDLLEQLINRARRAPPDPRQYRLLQILLTLQQTQGSTLRPSRPAAPPRPARTAPVLATRVIASDLSPAQRWQVLRWRLRGERAAPGLPPDWGAIPLASLWRQWPPAILRQWLLRQPDRAQLLPQLWVVPEAQRWLARLVPPRLRPLPALLQQALDWLPRAGLWQGSSSWLRQKLEPLLWQRALDPRAIQLSAAEFLAHCLLQWSPLLQLSAAELAARGQETAPTPTWRDACLRLQSWTEGKAVILPQLPASPPPRYLVPARPRPDSWGHWLSHPASQQQLLRLLSQRGPITLHRRHGVAAWPGSSDDALSEPQTEPRLAAAVYQLAWTRPHTLRQLLAQPWQRRSLQPRLTARLRRALPIPTLLDLIRRSPGAGSACLPLLQSWLRWQTLLRLPHESERDAWLWRALWQAWLYQDWSQLTPAALLAGFCQFYLPLSGQSARALAQRLHVSAAELAPELAPELAQALSERLPRDRAPSPPPQSAGQLNPVPPRPSPARLDDAARTDTRSRLQLSNAGLVLLATYLPRLFERLQLTRDQQFIDDTASRRAVLCLQYLACGQSAADEPALALNKLLCGWPLDQAVPAAIELNDEEREQMETLLQALCQHWPQSGCHSSDGLRGSWLWRPGVLADANDHWRLTVARQPWDILLAHFPLSYAVIKLPWMRKALYVTWPSALST